MFRWVRPRYPKMLSNLINQLKLQHQSSTMTSFNVIYFHKGFLFRTLKIHRKTAEEIRGPSLLLSPISIYSRTFKHLFATLHVTWLPFAFIFNFACEIASHVFITKALDEICPLLGISIWLNKCLTGHLIEHEHLIQIQKWSVSQP